MDKKAFLAELSKGLSSLSYEEQDKWLDFYAEMIEDRMEDGLSEEKAVAAIGSVEDVIAQILQQSQPEKKEKKKLNLEPWHLVLLIVGSPLWFSLLVAAASVVFSALVTVWAVIIGFYAAAVSLVAVGLASIFVLLIFWFRGYIGAAIFCFGAGLFCAGLGILWFMGTNRLVKGVVWLCKKLFSLCFRRKEAA